MKARERLDLLLVARGLAESREKAQGLILAGKVRVDGRASTKPGLKLDPAVAIECEAAPQPVGRGYRKLAGARARLGLEVADRVALDAGASTGGFTEHLLEAGARLVYAVDVGTNQLAWKLRTDPRVVSMERTNLRDVDPARFQPRPTVLAMDLSFISIAKVLPALTRVLEPGSSGLVLVKPQFEAGPSRVEAGGLVRDPAVHRDVLEAVVEACSALGWSTLAACPSPIRGATGNVEFFLKVRTPDGPAARLDPAALAHVVAEAAALPEP